MLFDNPQGVHVKRSAKSFEDETLGPAPDLLVVGAIRRLRFRANRPFPRQRRSAERGASAVEFAIILPFLIGILVGMMEFSLLLKNVALTGSAVNGASRLASVESRKAQYQKHALDSVVDLLKRNSLEADKVVIFKVDKATGLPLNGKPAGDPAGVLSDPKDFSTCVAECFVWTKTATGYDLKLDTSDPLNPAKVVQWPWWKQAACGGPGDTDYLGVWVELRHRFVTPIFGEERRIRRAGVYRLEPVAYANSDECDGSTTPEPLRCNGSPMPLAAEQYWHFGCFVLWKV
jgi:TadE-like protein